MQEKIRFAKKHRAIGGLRVNLADRTAHLSSMMQSYKVRLSGLSHANADGTNRQEIVISCKVGEELDLVREPENPKDQAAVAVYSRGRKLGYLPAGDMRLAVHMDAGFEVFANIVAIDGGPTFVQRLCWWREPGNYGCVVQIHKGYKKKI